MIYLGSIGISITSRLANNIKQKYGLFPKFLLVVIVA